MSKPIKLKHGPKGYAKIGATLTKAEIQEVILDLREVGKTDGLICASVAADLIEASLSRCVRNLAGCDGPRSPTECLVCSQWRANNPLPGEQVGEVVMYPAAYEYQEHIGVRWNNNWNSYPKVGTKLYSAPQEEA